MKLSKIILLFSVFICASHLSPAQNNHPKGYFLFPINPGQVNYLAANMGELRNNHFHGGMDVKTNTKIGYPVYASAEGYVQRIKVSSFGYGNVVYIRHPNNYVTVYAHLDKFNTPIGDYLRKRQYENQTFDIDVYPSRNELKISKGEVIGLAGNSGSSTGPHLHYEIRDTNDVVFNPSDFGFKEVSDNLPPIFDKVAFYPLDIRSRVNNEFGRQEFKALKSGNGYILDTKITASGSFGIELKAYDKKSGVHNTFGVNFIQVFFDDKEVFRHELNKFTFDETRYINVHINYPHFSATAKRFERLFIADGNPISTYQADASKGKINIHDNQPHKVRIVIKDDFNNTSILTFSIQGNQIDATPVKTTTVPNQGITTQIFENILKISTKSTGDPGTVLYLKGSSQELPAAYVKAGNTVFLYDLRKGLPDSVKVGNVKEKFNFIKMIPSGQGQQIRHDQFSLTIPPKTFSDTVYFEYSKEHQGKSYIYQIHHKRVPLFDTLTLLLRPDDTVTNKSRTFLYSMNSGKPTFEGGEWKGDKIELKTRNLGNFTLAEDTVKPTITSLGTYGNSIRFNIHDQLSGIKSFNAKLNGYWILMNYDHKRRLLWSERLDKTIPLKGKFELEVMDNAGNVNNFVINL